ncbi:MAG TPA: hypothetical protein VFG42_02120 [Baekduia sp.]|uniref:hypothetical protein n=1 Tax=Baekduia sp. TaxID=2600305 RepID=UPI002D7907F8|nr:hypothetical protein [Baekduia sp.]HET6505562.1 hypothetical protein [Baekduia sp.]
MMSLFRRAPMASACLIAAAGAGAMAPAATASAPGWSTPHTASVVPFGIYGAAPNGQGVQLFATPGASQSRTAAMRAIKSDATQGKAVTIDANGRPGVGLLSLAINTNAKLVSAWSLDTLSVGPIGLAAALGARTALPQVGTVLPTTGSVSAVATTMSQANTATVAWIESDATTTWIKAATLRADATPIVTVLGTDTGSAEVENLSAGLDGSGRPTVTWTSTTPNGTPTTIAVARGDGTGAFAPATVQTLTATAPVSSERTFVRDGGALTAVWVESGSTPSAPATLRTADAPAGGAFGAPRTISTAVTGAVSWAGALDGRVALFYLTSAGPRVTLRSTSGTWGATRAVGPSGKRSVRTLSVGVDASGRVVLLWDDGPASSAPNRILTARSSSSSNPPGAYDQVAQRGGDKNCAKPSLAVSSSGDGLGSWLCDITSKSQGSPRLARLTKPSS